MAHKLTDLERHSLSQTAYGRKALSIIDATTSILERIYDWDDRQGDPTRLVGESFVCLMCDVDRILGKAK